jgi:hypothetical protein
MGDNVPGRLQSATLLVRDVTLALGLAAAVTAMVGAARAAVDISSRPTKNMSCSDGICSPTAKKAVLNVGDLASMLQAADVKVTTGSGAITIEVTAAMSWASSNRLTLEANCNVSFKAPVTVAGTGAMTIVTNDGGSGCDLLFFPGGKVDFWDLSSSLVINGTSYELVNDIKTLAADIGANPSGAFALAKDYDASADGTYTRPPIAAELRGKFDGLGHTISKQAIHGGSKVPNLGLFGKSFGTIARLVLENVSVLANGEYVGGLIGINNGTLVGDSTSGEVRARFESQIGGLAGLNTGAIERSGSSAAIRAPLHSDAGGLVGTTTGSIVNSHATGDVTDHFQATGMIAGGLVGFVDIGGSVADSYATGKVLIEDSGLVGGFVGYKRGSISQSFAIGEVALAGDYPTCNYSGGFAGRNDGSVGDSYSTTAASAYCGYAGGFAGLNYGTMHNAYSIGRVAGEFVGGFVGDEQNPGSISNGYWDLDTSNINDTTLGAGNIRNDPGIEGLTDAQLKFNLPDGFDSGLWGQSDKINGGYPYLLANPPPE